MQRNSVLQHKFNNGWLDSSTPPAGQQLDANGFAVAFAQISQVSMVSNTTPNTTPPSPHPNLTLQPPSNDSAIPSTIQAPVGNAGAAFGRSGQVTYVAHSPATASIAPVSISGRHYNGHIFDANGNILN